MMIFLAMLDTEEEKAVFSQIYEKYRYFMWYLANDILKDPHLAEDAVQDAFLALTRHLDKIDEVESSRTKKFLATIVKSKAIDIIRKKQDRETLAGEQEEIMAAESADVVLEEYISQDNYEQLLTCVGALKDIYKVVFEYKYVHQLTDKEIADILGVSMKVVNVRIFRARKMLQQLLQKGGAEVG